MLLMLSLDYLDAQGAVVINDDRGHHSRRAPSIFEASRTFRCRFDAFRKRFRHTALPYRVH